MQLIVRRLVDKDWFQIDIGSYPKHEIHYNRLHNYCTPELISLLAEKKEVECIIISKEQLESYINATKIATAFENVFTE